MPASLTRLQQPYSPSLGSPRVPHRAPPRTRADHPISASAAARRRTQSPPPAAPSSCVCDAPQPQQQSAQQPAQQHQQHHRQQQQLPRSSTGAAAAAVVAVSAACLLTPGAASALELHAEPANALSLPTWAIHVSSVTEWVAAMLLMWRYAEVTGNARWKGMAWGMMPSLGSAMAACTWHFFYNSPDLDFLVALQAFLTFVGNCTCWLAAYRIYTAAREAEAA